VTIEHVVARGDGHGPPDAPWIPAARGVTLVGRDAELAQIQAVLDAQGSLGQLVLITGEAGIGKTTVATAIAEQAAAHGWRVASGRCWDQVGAPAFWPWAQVLRALLADLTPRDLDADTSAWLTELDPSLRSLVGATAPAPDLPAAQARFAMLDAVGRLFADRCAGGERLLVVLDDLHAADGSSLELARFLCRSLPGRPFVMLGTVRPAGSATPDEVRRLLDELERDATRIELPALSGDAVRDLVSARTGKTPDASEVKELMRTSGGNPFFIGQLVSSRLGGTAVPPSLKNVLRQRVADLSDAARDVMSVAAVFGVEFDPALLPEMAATSMAVVQTSLAEATAAGLAGPVIDKPGSYSFTHGLIQRFLVAELPAAERGKIHHRIADAVEPGAAIDMRWAALFAAHCRAGVDQVGVARMVDACLRAAAAAQHSLAIEVAADELTAGLELLKSHRTQFAAERAAMLLALAQAQALLGHGGDSRASYERAAFAARTARRPDLLAACAIATPRTADALRLDPGVRQLLDEALAGVGDDQPDLKAPLLARLVTELPFEDVEGRVATAARALEMARQAGERTVAQVLRFRVMGIYDPGFAPESVEHAEELLRLAVELRDPMLELDAWLGVFGARLATGDVRGAGDALGQFDDAIATMNAPLLRAASLTRHATLELLRGKFDNVLPLANEALGLRQQAGDPDAPRNWGAQVTTLWNFQGNPAGADALAAVPDHIPVPRLVLAKFFMDAGRTELAKIEAQRGLAQLQGSRASLFLSGLAAGAEVAAGLRHRAVAEAVLPRLEPGADEVNVSSQGALCLGSNHYFVGLCLSALDRFDEAITALNAAVNANKRIGAAPFVAKALLELARTHALRAAPGDAVIARRCAGDARRLGSELGMPWVVGPAQELFDGLAVSRASQPQQAQPAATKHVWSLTRDGDVWVLSNTDRHRHLLRHSKGLEHLSVLLRWPGREVAAIDLVAGPGAARPASTGEVLDAAARKAYQQRLAGLEAAAEAADRTGDAEAAARISDERDALVAELRSAAGLGGRSRRFSDDAERARVNVTRTIRQAIERIAEVSPDVGLHLRQRVRTGARCCYQPEDQDAFAWKS